MSVGRLAVTGILALAAAGTSWRASLAPQEPDPPLAAAVRQETAAAAPLRFVDPVAADPAAYRPILDRPLLSPTRTPFVPPPAAVVAAEPAPEPEVEPPPEPPPITFRVVGALRDGPAQAALLRSGEDERERWVRLGEAHEGWTVTAIGSTSVTVAAAGTSRELRIFAPPEGAADEE